ncbi:MAG: M14 family zinc carboxypeptidase [Fidelibacterota bacterium]
MNKITILLFISIIFGQTMRTHDHPGLGDYETPFFLNGVYDNNIQSPSVFFGFELGSRPVRHWEAKTYFEYLDAALENATLYSYGQTYEGRELIYLTITSKENDKNIEQHRKNLQKLADPRKLNKRENVDNIIHSTPAVAWMAYAIHGDEVSSPDAAVFLAYQLAAGIDTLTQKILENIIVCIDPLENPDGRARILSQHQQWGGVIPNPDVQSLNHRGMWPWGRTNHYLFDLNRDWFATVHPESRGIVQAILDWKPQLLVDAHEMGAYDTYLFNPPREPYNPYNHPTLHKWWKQFATDQANAFNQYGWSYYTRDWNEEIYPGYGSSWGIFAGMVGILYEQSRTSGQLIKRPDGSKTTFREAVHHQFISSMANLSTAAAHREELLRDYYHIRKNAVDSDPKEAFVFPLSDNLDRLDAFAETLKRQTIEVYVTENDIRLASAKTSANNIIKNTRIKGGALIVPVNQPLKALIQNILQFDIRLDTKSMEKERREVLKNSESTLYDVTAWSLPLAFGLEGFYTTSLPRFDMRPYDHLSDDGELLNTNAEYGFIIDGAEDGIYIALSRLMENKIKLWAVMEPVQIEGQTYAAGSILIRKQSNPKLNVELLSQIASESGINIVGIGTALAESGPDLGGNDVNLLQSARIALIGGPPISQYSFGSVWHLLDSRLQTRTTLLNFMSVRRTDLRKYNVIVLPSSWGGAYKDILGKGGIKKLKDWVKDGGTLIAIGAAASFIADSSSGLSSVRKRRNILKELDSYQYNLSQYQATGSIAVDSLELWEGKQSEDETTKENDKKKSDISELKDQDELGRKLSPQGAILRVNLDPEHWLNFGCGDMTPVLFGTSTVLMTKNPAHSPARLAPASDLRLGGLLWPEAKERIANGAWATRERLGNGQVILFATQPNFRGYFRGSERLLLNAMFYGPGLGARASVEW